ncbi:MAG: hypothetical protein WDA21_02120 [Bacilli bacterium]
MKGKIPYILIGAGMVLAYQNFNGKIKNKIKSSMSKMTNRTNNKLENMM